MVELSYQPLLQCDRCGGLVRHEKLREENAPVLDYVDAAHGGARFRVPRQHMVRTSAGPAADEMTIEVFGCTGCQAERVFGAR